VDFIYFSLIGKKFKQYIFYTVYLSQQQQAFLLCIFSVKNRNYIFFLHLIQSC